MSKTDILEIVLTKGIQASGKSTWAKKMIAQSDKWRRVNKDEIRWMTFGKKWDPSKERFVERVRDSIISECLRKGLNVIVDDTNFADKHFKNICELVRRHNINAVVYEKYFPIDLSEAVERDKKRDIVIGERVIREYYNKWVKGRTIKENVAQFNKGDLNPPPREEKGILVEAPAIVMCDLDGTLALLNGRNPYDASKCEDDLINVPVRDILVSQRESFYRSTVFLSGREDKYRTQTKRFIRKHLTGWEEPLYELHMRKSGDFRPDTVVKHEMFMDHIYNKYRVAFVIDDRPSVCRMWRDLGLTVLQVNDEEF